MEKGALCHCLITGKKVRRSASTPGHPETELELWQVRLTTLALPSTGRLVQQLSKGKSLGRHLFTQSEDLVFPGSPSSYFRKLVGRLSLWTVSEGRK